MGKLVLLRTSVRANSNSNALADAAAAAAREAGAEVREEDVGKLAVGYCRACDACRETGRCVFKDDLMPLLDDIWEAGALLVATPVYYMGAPAPLKLVIDRTQCLFNRKYALKDRLPRGEVARRRAGAMAVAGSRHPRAFEGFDLTMKYFFDSLQMTFAERLYVGRVDAPGEIFTKSPGSLDDAGRIARALVAPDIPPAE